MTEIADLPNGYLAVPPGKLANAVVWLEMRAKPVERLAEPLTLAPATDAGEGCRELYRAVGTPWLWSRAWHPFDPASCDTHAAFDDAGHRVGLVEFGGRGGPDVEIIYFGLLPEEMGKGLGRRLMAAALDLAWASAGQVWLHTCSFDHPSALRFYQSCGFVPYATGFEIMDDPRLDGSLPVTAAPHVPLIRPNVS